MLRATTASPGMKSIIVDDHHNNSKRSKNRWKLLSRDSRGIRFTSEKSQNRFFCDFTTISLQVYLCYNHATLKQTVLHFPFILSINLAIFSTLQKPPVQIPIWCVYDRDVKKSCRCSHCCMGKVASASSNSCQIVAR